MSNIYFGEGENEENLIRHLKEKNIISGKFKKFNLWENDFSKMERQYNAKKDYLMFVIDIDRINNTKIFINNTGVLKGYKFCFIVQNKNFEDELCNACNIKLRQLLKIFKSRNKDEFKSNFNSTTNLLNKLEQNNFEFDNFWKTDKISLRNQQLSSVINDNICKNNKYRLVKK